MLVSRRQLAERIGVCEGTISNWITKKILPPLIILGPKKQGWLESQISQWLAERGMAGEVSNGEEES